MKIAIIGSGISGLVAAYLLHKEHDVQVFEANTYVGGHTYTHSFSLNNHPYTIDTGFIVYNNVTYPNFCKLLAKLAVPSKLSDMGFSVQNKASGLEYNGSSINQVFAQRKNIVNLRFYQLLFEIIKFNRKATQSILTSNSPQTLAEFLDAHQFSELFRANYLYPMAAALWSSSLDNVKEMPICFFINFFKNHGLLSVNEHLQWRVIAGGSTTYVKKLIAHFPDKITLKTKINAVQRFPDYVLLQTEHGENLKFDQVIFANHSDEALAILTDPSKEEQSILSSIPYQPSEVALHYDERLLPTCKRAWASWNYRVNENSFSQPTVTYYMNRLQGLELPWHFCVSLNQTKLIDPKKIIKVFHYSHPIYTPDSFCAQSRVNLISGINRTHYCGAYWGYGFHEDGVNSALKVCEYFGQTL
jgi:predicted NAD/FAD-binding protein